MKAFVNTVCCPADADADAIVVISVFVVVIVVVSVVVVIIVVVVVAVAVVNVNALVNKEIIRYNGSLSRYPDAQNMELGSVTFVQKQAGA